MLEYGQCSLDSLLKTGRIYTEDEVIILMKPICEAFYKLQTVSKVANLDVKP